MDNEESRALPPDNPAPPAREEQAPEPQSVPPQSRPPSDQPQEVPQEPQVSQESQPEQPEEPAQSQASPEVKPPPNDSDDRTALIRYGHMNMLGDFRRPKDVTLSAGMKIIVRTERGIELGRVVLGYCEGAGDRGISRQRWQEYLCGCGMDEAISRNGQILRIATVQDLSDQRHLDESVGEKLSMCRKIIGQMSLQMKPVAVEHLFGGDRIIFYFKSEKRVDFRRLVRRLAKEYQTRIEMRQVGARDEAKLLADYERCGRACCCRSFLKMLAPVNMRMAKVQKATLDPAKISGRCGRLMCCLRYENSTYDQLRKNLPPRNTAVETPDGTGVVVDRQILTQLVVVRLADARRIAYPLADITVQPRGSAKVSKDNVKNSAGKESLNNDQSSDQPNQSDMPAGKRRRRGNRRNPNR